MKSENDHLGQISARLPKETIETIKNLVRENREQKNEPKSIQQATIKYWRTYLKKKGVNTDENGNIIE